MSIFLPGPRGPDDPNEFGSRSHDKGGYPHHRYGDIKELRYTPDRPAWPIGPSEDFFESGADLHFETLGEYGGGYHRYMITQSGEELLDNLQGSMDDKCASNNERADFVLLAFVSRSEPTAEEVSGWVNQNWGGSQNGPRALQVLEVLRSRGYVV